jgi:DtxR family transcriptional regulator, Mn-dependent transcriptional regulator
MARVATGHSVDEYLETIYFLAFPIGEYHPRDTSLPTLSSRVAEMLGVSRASAGEMLKRLESEGLVERGARKEALLTEAEAHVHADDLGDTFSDEMVERIRVRLGSPDRCPHGWPIDTEFEQEENRELESLSHLAPGTRATIVRLAEHDGDLLHWFYDEGLVPGATLELESVQPAAGQLRVRLEDGTRTVADKAAAGLFVRAA